MRVDDPPDRSRRLIDSVEATSERWVWRPMGRRLGAAGRRLVLFAVTLLCAVMTTGCCGLRSAPAEAADVGLTIRLWRLFTEELKIAYVVGFTEGALSSGATCRRPFATPGQIIERTEQWIKQMNMPADGVVGAVVALSMKEFGCAGIGEETRPAPND
jgi:hypothetical protein